MPLILIENQHGYTCVMKRIVNESILLAKYNMQEINYMLDLRSFVCLGRKIVNVM